MEIPVMHLALTIPGVDSRRNYQTVALAAGAVFG